MVRIALISDIHFGQLSRTAEFSVPGEPIEDENVGGTSLKDSLISTLKETNVQYLCISGDLTSIGSPQEFSFCEQAILSIADKAEIPHDRIILGLGNHDIDWKISKICDDYASNESNFPHELVQEKYQKIAASAALININSIPKPCQCGPAPFSGIVENEDFVMFVLNSGWCCTHDQAFSHGKLEIEQLEWFKASAEKYKTDKRWKIVLMHHHPFSYNFPLPNVDISMLEEGSQFLEIAGQNGINLVLHGHCHHPKAETSVKTGWEHPITFICAGSLAVNSAHRSSGFIPNTLHIIELSEEVGVLKLNNYQYSPTQGWIPIKNNCPETPLDYKMMLGKLYSAGDIHRSIQKLATYEMELQWENLDDCLRFLTFNELNQKIKEQLSDTHKMYGIFPQEVFLIKK